ncbi:MAG TPA: glycoside hydrolase family 43 protein [Anaerohalosphaeraceae bacterium]|nr:glycoside hydrolase family 43 protein [Anaerohalosphaeraceae bacterium]
MYSKSLLIFCTLCLIAMMHAGCLAGSDTTAQKPVYLFSYFVDNGQDGLHLACSPDGLEWKALNQGKSYLKPAVGKDKLMRDPCVLRGPDGLFHMVWTVSWKEKGIGYASSKDLITWSEQQYIPVMEHEPTAQNCWAPELIYDAQTKQYLIFWATTIPGRFPETEKGGDNNHRIYYVTTRDFKTYSETKLLLEPGFNVIDSTIIQAGGKWGMFLKNETKNPPEKNIRISTADRPEGPWSPASDAITGKYWAEGPTAVQIGEWWYLYFDKYTEGKYGALRSKDLKNWEDISSQLRYPRGLRHGTVFAVEPEILKTLLANENTQ